MVNLTLENLQGVQTVLDIGTGSGLFAEQFAAKGLQVTGLDADSGNAASRSTICAVWDIPGKAKPRTAFWMDLSTWCSWECCCMKPTTPWRLQGSASGGCRTLVVLEWPDEEQSYGPPRDRLSFERIASLAKQAGIQTATPDPIGKFSTLSNGSNGFK